MKICLPEHELDDVLVWIVLGIVEGCVSTGVNSIDDRLHPKLDKHVVVAEQGVDGLLVHVPALVPVYQDLQIRPINIDNCVWRRKPCCCILLSKPCEELSG